MQTRIIDSITDVIVIRPDRIEKIFAAADAALEKIDQFNVEEEESYG